MTMTIDVHFDGRMIRLTGRAAQVIAWLIQRQEEIDREEKLNLSFDFAGRSMHVERRIRERYGADSAPDR